MSTGTPMKLHSNIPELRKSCCIVSRIIDYLMLLWQRPVTKL